MLFYDIELVVSKNIKCAIIKDIYAVINIHIS